MQGDFDEPGQACHTPHGPFVVGAQPAGAESLYNRGDPPFSVGLYRQEFLVVPEVGEVTGLIGRHFKQGAVDPSGRML